MSFEGGGVSTTLSLCRGLLCSIFLRFVVAILILNHNCGWQGRELMRGGEGGGLILVWRLENSTSTQGCQSPESLVLQLYEHKWFVHAWERKPMQKERDNHECASAPLMYIWECAGVTVYECRLCTHRCKSYVSLCLPMSLCTTVYRTMSV